MYELGENRLWLESTNDKSVGCYGNRWHLQCVCFVAHSLQDLLEVLVTGPKGVVQGVGNDQVPTTNGSMLNMNSHIQKVHTYIWEQVAVCISDV